MIALPSPVPRWLARTATRPILPVSPSINIRAVPTSMVTVESDQVQCIAVTPVAFLGLRHPLFFDEDGSSNGQHRLHIRRTGLPYHAKYPSRMRR